MSKDMPVLKHAHHNHPAQQAEDQFSLGKTGPEPILRLPPATDFRTG